MQSSFLLTTAVLLSVASPAQEMQKTLDRVRISSGLMSGLLVKKVEPRFPHAAVEQRVNGAVVFHVVVGKDGHVLEVTPISGPELLRENYASAIRQWEYKPYLLNGRPVEVETTVTLSLQMGASLVDASPLPAGRVRVSSGVMAGQVVKHPWPLYPQYTQDDKLSGATVLHVVVGRDGKVKEVTVISGVPARQQYEVDAVKLWEYRPFLLNGEPVEVDTTVTLQPGFGG